MTTSPQGPLLFGDLLARARQSWVREMTIRLTNEGFSDYKASDALALRILRAGSTPFARFTKILGTSRQAAMKVVDGLIRRGLANLDVDPADARRRIVQLTPEGRRYAKRVVAVLNELNEEITAKIAPSDLETTRDVLHFLHSTYGASAPTR